MSDDLTNAMHLHLYEVAVERCGVYRSVGVCFRFSNLGPIHNSLVAVQIA